MARTSTTEKRNRALEQVEALRTECDRLRTALAGAEDLLKLRAKSEEAPVAATAVEEAPKAFTVLSYKEFRGKYAAWKATEGRKSVTKSEVDVAWEVYKRRKVLGTCGKCNGTGHYHTGGECYMCAGKGTLTIGDLVRNRVYWLHNA